MTQWSMPMPTWASHPRQRWRRRQGYWRCSLKLSPNTCLCWRQCRSCGVSMCNCSNVYLYFPLSPIPLPLPPPPLFHLPLPPPPPPPPLSHPSSSSSSLSSLPSFSHSFSPSFIPLPPPSLSHPIYSPGVEAPMKRLQPCLYQFIQDRLLKGKNPTPELKKESVTRFLAPFIPSVNTTMV